MDFFSQKVISLIRGEITPERFPYLTILSHIFLGLSLGRILVVPAEELVESISIKFFLITGACLFFNYLLCARKAAKGIICCPSGKIRPSFKELLLCAVMNAIIFLLSMSLFFFKSLYIQ